MSTFYQLDPGGLSYEDNVNAVKKSEPFPSPFQIRHHTSVLASWILSYITPLMPSAAEYWLLNPTKIKYNQVFVSAVLLHIQTQIFGVHSSYYCVQPKPNDYFVDNTEKHRLQSMCFLFERREKSRLNPTGARGSYDIAPRYKGRRKKQQNCCGLELMNLFPCRNHKHNFPSMGHNSSPTNY